jgi:hypothetical protein
MQKAVWARSGTLSIWLALTKSGALWQMLRIMSR